MIDRLYVQNFRCLESTTLDFIGRRSSLLIGKNGAGKSTVLECLRVLQKICRGGGRAARLISKGDFTQNQTDRPIRFEVDLTLGGRKYHYAISFEWPPDFHEARILDENLVADGQPVFTRHRGQVQLAGGAAFGLDWHVFALPVINERAGEHAIQDVRAFLASLILVAPAPERMSGFSEEPSLELEDDAANFASCLAALLMRKPAAYGEFVSYVKGMIGDFLSIENVPRGESGTQLIVKFRQDAPQRDLSVEFKALSEGEKCFFLSSYICAANAVGWPVVCMWDEPDNHLSLSEIGQFILGLRKTADTGGSQFIATSHNPETIRKFSDDTTFVLTRKSHLDPTVPRLLSEFSYNGDLINALIRDEIVG